MHTRKLKLGKHLFGLWAGGLLLLLMGTIGGARAQVATSPPAAPSIAAVPGLAAALSSKAPLNPNTLLTAPLVATNTTANLASHTTGTDTQYNFQSVHIATADVTALKLTWQNNQAQPITMTAAVWLPGGSLPPATSLQVTWNGATSVTIPGANTAHPIQYATSDWIQIPLIGVPGYTYTVKLGTDSGAFNVTQSRTTTAAGGAGLSSGYMPAGTPFCVREFVTGTAATIPVGLAPGYNYYEGSSHSSAEVDETMMTNTALSALTPTYAAGNTTGGWQSGVNPPDLFTGGNTPSLIYCPSAIQGQAILSASYPYGLYSIAVYGDSISNGTGDQWQSGPSGGSSVNFNTTNPTISGGGAIVRACEQLNIPILQAGIYGASFSGTDNIFYPYAPGCTHALLEMGINYIRSTTDGTANANVSANTTTCINALKAAIGTIKRRNPAVKCILWTYLPATTSNTGTGLGAYENTRVSINTYIRANYAAMGAVDYVDAANAVEATAGSQGTLAQNGGAWSTLGNGGTGVTTADGTHPNNYGHGLIAAAIIAKINAGMLAK